MPFWIPRASIKIASKCFARCFHAPAPTEPIPHRAETLWFVKVVCTISVRKSDDLAVFNSDYFNRHLNPTVALFVIHHLNYNFKNPGIAFEFFQFTRVNLRFVYPGPTFNLLLRSLCQMGFLDSARLLVNCMSSVGFLPERPVLEFLVCCFADAGKFCLAEEILVSLARLSKEKEMVISSAVHNVLLSALLKQHRVDDAVRFFRHHILRLRGFCPDTCSFNIVIDGLCRRGNVSEAFEFFNDMERFGCLPDRITYNCLIKGLRMVSDMNRAVELLREMQSRAGVSPDVITYTSIISGLCKLKRMEEAAGFLDEMIYYGITPNLITLNTLIDGFGKSGDMNSALKMMSQMASVNCFPDVVTFTSLISGHCLAGELDKGLKLKDEMVSKELFPNVYTFSILVCALCRENRINEARDLLRELLWRDDIVPKAFIYNPVIDGFCKAGNVDEANAIVEEMETKKCSPDKYTFTILIVGHCMKGRMYEAIDIYNKMSVVGCVPDEITINSLISCLLKSGMTNEAYRIKRAASKGMQPDLPSCKRPKPVNDKMVIPVAV